MRKRCQEEVVEEEEDEEDDDDDAEEEEEEGEEGGQRPALWPCVLQSRPVHQSSPLPSLR